MGNKERNSSYSNHVEEMDPAKRFAKLTPWQIVQNTMHFAQDVVRDPVTDKRITRAVEFEYQGESFAINFQAIGDDPIEIVLHGKKITEAEGAQPFSYTFTRKRVTNEGKKDQVDPHEIQRLIPLLGIANLELTRPEVRVDLR